MTKAGTLELSQSSGHVLGQDVAAETVSLKWSHPLQSDLQMAQGKESHLVLTGSVNQCRLQSSARRAPHLRKFLRKIQP